MATHNLVGHAINHLHDAGLAPTFPRIVMAKLLLEDCHACEVTQLVDRARQDQVVLCPTAVTMTLACFEKAGLLQVLRADGARP